MPMDESFKVTKSGTAYVLSHYKSNNMCQGAPFQYPAVEANTCNYDPSQLEWQSLVVAEIANDGTVPGTSSPATGSTTTSAPATGNTATRSPKTSSGTGLVAGQTVLVLVFAALAL
ncbi:hypothetical protein BASA82_000249 [Batrachochytrium salamandrivorans]|nr:hypothetical protein BASA82_000249 [Batrachochytrium salamandrivorans]